MSLFEAIKNLDKKFSWSFWGFVLAVIFGAITVHDKFIADKHPQFYLDILTNTAVLDIKEDLPKLNIIYDKIDIRKQQMSLSIIAVKVINDSSQDVLKNYYDTDDPFGIKINEGRIIKAELTTVTNEYLKKNLNLTSSSNSTLLVKPVVMEGYNFFIVKLLVLHPAKTPVSIESVGHVAGMMTIPTRDVYKDIGKESVWTSSFKGSWEIQLVRVVSYFLIGIVVILGVVVLVVLPVSLLKDKLAKRKRAEIVSEFRNTFKSNYDGKDDYLLNMYKEHGVESVEMIHHLLTDQSQLTIYCRKYERRRRESDVKNKNHEEFVVREQFDLMGGLVPHGIIRELLDNGVISKQDKHYEADKHATETLKHFMKYLKSRNLLSDNKYHNGGQEVFVNKAINTATIKED